MSGSSRRPPSYPPPLRPQDNEDQELAVTQASFESLALTRSVGSQRYQVLLSSYQVPDPLYTQHHFGGIDPSTNYFHPYGSTNYSIGSPVTFAESSQTYSTAGVPPETPLATSTSPYVTDSVSCEPQAMPGPDMR